MDFPNLEIIEARTLEEIGQKTAGMIQGLAPNASVAVSGGTTYRKIVQVWRKALGKARPRLFPVDDRIVPLSSAGSNWGMIRTDLLDPLDWPRSKRCFLEAVEGDVAGDYHELLKMHFDGPMPRFDLMFLGVGSDGHTASLFPGTRELDDDVSWVLETRSPTPPNRRITLGMGVISRARQVVIIVTGSDKAPVVRRMLRADAALPIVRILKSPVEKVLFVDKDAAG